MDEIPNKILEEAEKFIIYILEKYNDSLDQDTIDQVNYYKDHSEIEMACEGLIIELIKLKKKSVSIRDAKQCLELCKKIRLDKSSVFDSDFWSNICHWYNSL